MTEPVLTRGGRSHIIHACLMFAYVMPMIPPHIAVQTLSIIAKSRLSQRLSPTEQVSKILSCHC
jgi:hypothetical protein